MINFWTVLGTIVCLTLAMMWVPVFPKRKRGDRDEKGLKLTPEIKKARETERKRVEELQDGRG